MLLVVSEHDLANLIQDLPGGWQNLQVRYLDTKMTGRYFNVHLSKKQAAALGAERIKSTYHATEYKQVNEGDASEQT